MSGPTRRRLLAAVGGAELAGLAGCPTPLPVGGGPCRTARRQMRLLAAEDYEEATRFVPYERTDGTTRADAADLMAFRGELLFPGGATLESFSCVCHETLSATARAALRRELDASEVEAPPGTVAAAQYVRYRVTAGLGDRTETDVYSDVFYHLDDAGPFVAFVSGTQKGRLPLAECR